MSATREELARTILESERDIIQSMQKIKAYDSSLQFLRRNIQKGNITLRELDSAGDQQKTFRPLGRAFILKSKDEIREELQTIMKSNEVDIQEYEISKGHYFKKKEELEKVFREGIEKHTAMS